MTPSVFLFRRTDAAAQAIEQIALQKLRQKGPALKAVGCRFRRGVLFLRGMVSSYDDKQFATRCVRSVPGVENIINLTRVGDKAMWPG